MKNPADFKVLIACEESQTVCKAFRERGFEAYSCDIIEPSGGHPEWHIKGDALAVINGRCTFRTMDGAEHKISGTWDLLIAHPPCTYLSNAGACRLYPRQGQLDMDRYRKGLEGKDFFMQFYNADCERICIENPVPSRVFELPEKTQVIQPYEFGHPYTKKTYLWLKGLPNLAPTDVVQKSDRHPYICGNSGIWKKQAAQGEVYGKEKSAKHRSKTFPNIAAAMAEQWGNALLEEE